MFVCRFEMVILKRSDHRIRNWIFGFNCGRSFISMD